MHRSSHTSVRRLGFTLIEILIVVVILGVLAAVVVASFNTTTDDARKNAFASSIKIFADASMRYALDNGAYVADGSSGQVPAGFAPYIEPNSYTAATPVGGVWDTELNSFGVVSAVGVHFNGTGPTRDDAYMVEIDAILDDGDLASGAFRKLAGDRYYWVIE
jgi:prepilin-type N-terminal cleavage/methylation domain-containing protein